MATTTSIVELVMRDIVTGLGSISVINSFRNDIKLVSRELITWDKLGTHQFPALFPILASVVYVNMTNKEIEADMKINILGYIRFNTETGETADNAEEKLISLYSDVMEKMYNRHINNFGGNTEDEFKFIDMETDEGTVFPYAWFSLNSELRVTFDRINVGRVIQT